MRPGFSTYLDLVRVTAALSVFLYHGWHLVHPGSGIRWPGHEAVVVFFVLSGFMIAAVVDRRDRSATAYALDRLSRLWSVALPALALGGMCSIVIAAAPADIAPPATGLLSTALRSLANIVFLGQNWSLRIVPPLNNPFWSLNYEAWYYAMFGVWAYATGYRRVAGIVVLGVLAGPKILLLMPCWLAGVWLHRQGSWLTLSRSRAGLLFAGTLLAFVAWTAYDAKLRITLLASLVIPLDGLGDAVTFGSDYLLAMIVVANFAAARSLERDVGLLLRLERPIRAIASCTLSIYLYHIPLLALFVGYAGLTNWTVLPLIVIVMICLAVVTEHRRPALRDIMRRCLSDPGMPAASAKPALS